MFGKEVFPKELRKINRKSFKNTQDIFRRRLREIAASGQKVAKYKADEYCCGEQIRGWLEGLGFKCVDTEDGWTEITWSWADPPKRTQYCHPDSKPIKDGKPAWYYYHWTKDPVQWDYVCSCCNEHSEYETKFCPNCGARMLIEEK